jgi:NADP-dependent 3-hydroxy acid dehydrogenase YdfG
MLEVVVAAIARLAQTKVCIKLIKMAVRDKHLFLTGASGLLGRAIYKKFITEGWVIYGTAYSR